MGRLRQSRVLPLVALLATLSSALNLDCEHLQSNKQVWNFKKLKGPHSVSHATETDAKSVHNTTYTVDICGALKGSECHSGAWVCGVVQIVPKDGSPIIDDHIDIAGMYPLGTSLDPRITNLKTINEREGVRLEMNGGRHPYEGTEGVKQMAIIDFLCDQERTGLEGLEKGGDDKLRIKRREAEQQLKARSPEDDNKGGSDEKEGNGDDKKDGDDTRSLRFKSYGHDEDRKADVLRLDWVTKYACDNYERDEEDPDSKNHWGFFTWFIVLLFLCASAYLIFGSWLNYNRYGARGWDMLPHGDAIRDVPYLLKDWGRRVASTIQGPGARGGYSAV